MAYGFSRVDEVIPLDHPRREASRVIQWYDLIHETWYSTPDHVTIIIMFLYRIIGVKWLTLTCTNVAKD